MNLINYFYLHIPRVFAVFSLLVLAACTRSVKVDGHWNDKAAEGTTFERVLIVGVSPNFNARCNFEMFLRTQIEVNGTMAQASCQLMSVSEELTRERIEEAIAEYQADAVLATVLVASDGGPEEGGDSDSRGGLYFKPKAYGYRSPGYYGGGYYHGGYGVYGVPVVYGEFKRAPVITSVDGEVTVSSLLFETGSATLVYDLLTTVKGMDSQDDGLSSITPPIAGELRSKGLIR